MDTVDGTIVTVVVVIAVVLVVAALCASCAVAEHVHRAHVARTERANAARWQRVPIEEVPDFSPVQLSDLSAATHGTLTSPPELTADSRQELPPLTIRVEGLSATFFHPLTVEEAEAIRALSESLRALPTDADGNEYNEPTPDPDPTPVEPAPAPAPEPTPPSWATSTQVEAWQVLRRQHLSEHAGHE